jgi:hypothetical protein
MENSLQCKDFTCQQLYACILTATLFLEANEPGDLHLTACSFGWWLMAGADLF